MLIDLVLVVTGLSAILADWEQTCEEDDGGDKDDKELHLL